MNKTRATTMTAALCVCLILATFASGQVGDEGHRVSFALPQHGSLILNVPSRWKQKVSQQYEGLPPIIELTPGQGDDFKVVISPLWSPEKSLTFNNSSEVRRLIDKDLSTMLPGVVEKQVSVEEVSGTDGTGYYFFVTDKAPKPGAYPYVVRAAIGVGDLLLNVTILCRSKDNEGITETIHALETAKQGERRVAQPEQH